MHRIPKEPNAGLFPADRTPSPWESEPDSLDFEHLGIECRIRRVAWSGHLCGYVRLPAEHPWREDDDLAFIVDVHGGITFGPRPIDGGGVWIGFDCAHVGDLMPTAPMDHQGTYRDLAYVRAECEKLAEQILAAGAK